MMHGGAQNGRGAVREGGGPASGTAAKPIALPWPGVGFRLEPGLPVEGWLAITLLREPPYYRLDRILCWAVRDRHGYGDLLALVPGSSPHLWEEDFIVSQVGFVHAGDITTEMRAHWESEGKGWSEHCAHVEEESAARSARDRDRRLARKAASEAEVGR